MPAKERPNLARKVTPKSEQKRKDALDGGVSMKVDGREYVVRAGDLTGLDVAALRREVGMSFVQLIDKLGDSPDVDLVAALMWLSRRIDGERSLAYSEVAAEVGYNVDIEVAEAKPETSPEV